MKQTYTIPADRREEVEKLVAKYQRKAEKYGLPLIVEYGEPHMAKVPIFERDEWGVAVQRIGEAYSFEAFDLTIDGEDIRKDGYTVAAKIEHMEGGNIVTTFNGETKAAWQKSDCRCEHCCTSRARRLTFIVRHEDGGEKQVGSTCLKDYCGIDPQAIGARNELTALILGYDVERYDFDARPVACVYDTIDALAFAIATASRQGYIRSGEPGANKEIIADLLRSDRPTEAELLKAQSMAAEIDRASDDDARAFLLDNVQTLIRGGYCKRTHLEFVAYAPVAYAKYQAEMRKRAAREAEREAQASTSRYVGEVGKRLVFDIAKMELLTSWETQYGWTYLYKFLDTEGNVLVWFSSGLFGRWTENGDFEQYESVSKIKATVKEHTERDGVKQTVITRCKAV